MKLLKEIWQFIYQVFDKFGSDKAPKLGAALSFYTIFSLAPLLLIVIAVAGLLFGEDAARGEIVRQMSGLIGQEGAVVIQTALKNTQYAGDSILTLIISGITLIIGSTVVFVDLQDSLNMVWQIRPKEGRNMIKGLIRDRLISFGVVLGTGFLLLVSLILSAAITAVSSYFSEQFIAIPMWVLEVGNIILSLLVIFLLFMMIFRILPDAHIKWQHTWVGALVTAVLFVLGKYLIGLYLGQSTVSSTYGAAGSLVVLLLWVYYSSQILFLGAEFTQVYANKYGGGIKPKGKFVKYRTEAVEEKRGKDNPDEIK